jgi:hypothetical protein
VHSTTILLLSYSFLKVRLLTVREEEALGPCVARYMASKLWGGEEYFVQIDSHIW